MPFVNFRKKFRFFSFDFRQNFEFDLSKKFFFKIFTLVLLDRFLDGFSKFWFFIGEICILIRDFWVIFENYSLRMLSIRGTDFIACWAYEERISAHAQPAVKCEHFYMYDPCWACGTNFTAHWAYGELISSHAEHTGNRFHRMLSMRGNV